MSLHHDPEIDNMEWASPNSFEPRLGAHELSRGCCIPDRRLVNGSSSARVTATRFRPAAGSIFGGDDRFGSSFLVSLCPSDSDSEEEEEDDDNDEMAMAGRLPPLCSSREEAALARFGARYPDSSGVLFQDVRKQLFNFLTLDDPEDEAVHPALAGQAAPSGTLDESLERAPHKDEPQEPPPTPFSRCRSAPKSVTCNLPILASASSSMARVASQNGLRLKRNPSVDHGEGILRPGKLPKSSSYN